jgi:hypothetical protein
MKTGMNPWTEARCSDLPLPMGGISIEIHRLAPQLAFSTKSCLPLSIKHFRQDRKWDCKKDLHCSAKNSFVQRICRRVDTVFSANAIRDTTQLGHTDT